MITGLRFGQEVLLLLGGNEITDMIRPERIGVKKDDPILNPDPVLYCING